MTTDATERIATSESGSPDQLAHGAVTLFGDFVAAITNIAPSASVALSLGAIIAVSGFASPFIALVGGLTMLCIAVAYYFLNNWQPNAAAQALWLARIASPVTGLALGLFILAESIVSNMGNITLFGPYLLGIVWPSQAGNTTLQWIVSALIMGAVLYIAIAGVRRAIRFQQIIVWIEYAIILAFLVGLLVAEFTGHHGSQHPQLSWLSPGTSPSLHGLADGFVIGVSLFGGWEAAVYLAEEGTDTRRNPGRAGIIAVVFATIWYLLLIMAIQAIAPMKDLESHSANIIAYSAGVIWPKPWSTIVSLAVLSSVIAVTQSQLQAFSRMSFGLAREGLIWQKLASLSRHRTPRIALTIAAVLPVLLLIVYLANSSAAHALSLLAGMSGLMFILIYVAGALACIWYYRKTLLTSVRQFVVAGLLPFLGAGGLILAAIYALPTTPLGTKLPALGFLVAAILAALIIKVRNRNRTAFFDRPVMTATADSTAGSVTDDLVDEDGDAS
jgi:amino acid transporter